MAVRRKQVELRLAASNCYRMSRVATSARVSFLSLFRGGLYVRASSPPPGCGQYVLRKLEGPINGQTKLSVQPGEFRPVRQ